MSEELLYAGKAKSVYRSDSPGELIVVFRDDITAFDGGRKDVLSRKGEYNARVSAHLFELLEEAGVPTHFLRLEGPARMRVRRLAMVPLEVIVRNRAAGSLVRNYPFESGEPLDPPLIVIDHKDDARHDPMLNDEIILALGLLGRAELDAMKALALRVNGVLLELFGACGLDLVDFKVEFGRDEWGRLRLGDEVSMDSMRLWSRETGESLDKDVYRLGTGDVLGAYTRVAERLGLEM
ncbi:MAG: phosphoribosylaminoimidazolesuccinocarboxamide synthase [Methanospirillum sp.]